MSKTTVKRSGIKRGLVFGSALLIFLVLAAEGYLGVHQGPGEVTAIEIPESILSQRSETQTLSKAKLNVSTTKQILFGDLHVHTTFSSDAFLMNLPIASGDGTHPPADACDYARYCSALDFWSINDHAGSITPQKWAETKESIRQCNAVTNAEDPDVVAFLGYEWTNMSPSVASKHYGHKNVIFEHIEEDKVPAKPIYAKTDLLKAFEPPIFQKMGMPITGFPDNIHYLNHNKFAKEISSSPRCPEGVPSKDLPDDCMDGVLTPAQLFAKLDEQGHSAMVIPHGNSWGLYTPPSSTWDKQLVGDMQNAKYQFAIEIYSGHGNSEEYRSYKAYTLDDKGNKVCPEELDTYLPMCRQAGRIIKQRCLAEGFDSKECDKREIKAQNDLLATTYSYQESSPVGTTTPEWLNAGQCQDCFLPTFNHNPRTSTQYALAIGNFDDSSDSPRRFRFAIVAASDVHTARPGTGYKEIDRRENTEAAGVSSEILYQGQLALFGTPEARSEVHSTTEIRQELLLKHAERQFSFLSTGGLTAVHAEKRNRAGIWNAIQNKEVYGTSGDRILLWFDMLNPWSDTDPADENIAAMGSELKLAHTPKFRVKAVGAFKQKPGCPDYSTEALSEERLNKLCRNECFNPSNDRKLITRIEVIRIRPQIFKGENVDDLIEDVWLSHECEANQDGCEFEFEDPDFIKDKRESVYYVRAIEEPSLAVNGQNLRCEYDDKGKCIKVDACYGSSLQTDFQDDCLSELEERAWSSPIFIDYTSNEPAELNSQGLMGMELETKGSASAQTNAKPLENSVFADGNPS